MLTIMSDKIRALLPTASPTQPLRFVGYDFVYLFDVIPDNAGQIHNENLGNLAPYRTLTALDRMTVEYRGDISGMLYLQTAPNKHLIKMRVPETASFFRFNAMVTYVEFRGERLVFATHIAPTLNPKFSTLENDAGTAEYFPFTLVTSNGQRFDFTNLGKEATTFRTVNQFSDLGIAAKQDYTQFVVNSRNTKGQPAPTLAIRSLNRYFGTPLYPLNKQDRIIGERAFYLVPNSGVPLGFVLAKDADDNSIVDYQGYALMERA